MQEQVDVSRSHGLCPPFMPLAEFDITRCTNYYTFGDIKKKTGAGVFTGVS